MLVSTFVVCDISSTIAASIESRESRERAESVAKMRRQYLLLVDLSKKEYPYKKEAQKCIAIQALLLGDDCFAQSIIDSFNIRGRDNIYFGASIRFSKGGLFEKAKGMIEKISPDCNGIKTKKIAQTRLFIYETSLELSRLGFEGAFLAISRLKMKRQADLVYLLSGRFFDQGIPWEAIVNKLSKFNPFVIEQAAYSVIESVLKKGVTYEDFIPWLSIVPDRESRSTRDRVVAIAWEVGNNLLAKRLEDELGIVESRGYSALARQGKPMHAIAESELSLLKPALMRTSIESLKYLRICHRDNIVQELFLNGFVEEALAIP